MDLIETITESNHAFARDRFSELKIMPSQRALIIGCLDPRVDPMDILGLKPGEAAIIRNIGGRINPALVEVLVLLPVVAKAAGQEMGAGWNLIVLHHTDCGIIGCYKKAPELLAKHLGVPQDQLSSMAITDPRQAVAQDIAAYRANPQIPGGFTVSGLVYDVATGKLEVVVPPGPLREDG